MPGAVPGQQGNATMATYTLINPNPSLIGDLAFDPPPTEAWERLSEQISEMNEDADRAGYANWGSASTTLTMFGLTGAPPSPVYVNMQAGNDTLTLQNTGDDIAYMGSGNDKAFGGIGADTLYGGSGTDFLYGEAGNDTLYGGSGGDELRGGADADTLYGGSGVDLLLGGAGADVLYGGVDNDTLYGDGDGATQTTGGRDVLNGGFGNDTLYGGFGADTLFGNAGADTFAFQSASDLGYGHTDVIRDFSRTEGDRINLSGIDANTTLAGNQAFRFVTGPSETAGDMWLGEVINGRQHVYMNLDGVRTDLSPFAADIDLIVEFNDPTMTSLSVADFFR